MGHALPQKPRKENISVDGPLLASIRWAPFHFVDSCFDSWETSAEERHCVANGFWHPIDKAARAAIVLVRCRPPGRQLAQRGLRDSKNECLFRWRYPPRRRNQPHRESHS